MAEWRPEYTDYDYLGDDEAEYQGYDGYGSSGYSVHGSSWEKDETDYGDVDENDEDPDEVTESDDEPDDESEEDPDESDDEDDKRRASREAYCFNGRMFKDPRRYIQAVYQADISCYPQLEEEEKNSLAHIIRRGMLCDCSIMPEDPKVPEEYPYKLADRTSIARRRLHQTDEEKAWVDSLSLEEKRRIIAEGRAAQEKLTAHNLPLVMYIAQKEYNRMEYLDRIQAGNVGLLKAVQYFNPDKGVKFITFATYLIENEIRDCLKELNMQKAGPKIWDKRVIKDSDIDTVCDCMGGTFWMQEVTVDTDSTEDEIREMVAAMLEQKEYTESIANDVIQGYPKDYDAVILEAEEQGGEDSQEDDEEVGDSGHKKRRHLDLMKGDGKPPRKREMSSEDFVRSFFEMVGRIKNVPYDRLADFILKDRYGIETKACSLKAFLEQPWEYTAETAISDLGQLTGHGYLWPERLFLNQVKRWGWKGADDAPRCWDYDGFHDYIDPEHPTESAALILLDGYADAREPDIIADASITLEYYEWLDGIIHTTSDERLDELDRMLLADDGEGLTYEEKQAKHHISSKTVKDRKDQLLRCIYDQVIESSNRENGDALLKCLIQKYRAWEIKEWRDFVVDRMVRDHYVEKGIFSLRSRGMADPERPVMERFYRTVDRVRTSVSGILVPAIGIGEGVEASVDAAVQVFHDIMSSEAYEIWKEGWMESDGCDETAEDGSGFVADTHSVSQGGDCGKDMRIVSHSEAV